jgi:hypothetical protein
MKPYMRIGQHFRHKEWPKIKETWWISNGPFGRGERPEISFMERGKVKTTTGYEVVLIERYVEEGTWIPVYTIQDYLKLIR